MGYKAIIAKIDRVSAIQGADRIQTAYVLGEQVIVSKDWSPGEKGVLFPAESQLSEDFCKNNNLYRDSDRNKDKNKKGFFGNNRRVRAQPFMRVKSEGFFCGLDCFDYLDKEIPQELGSQFDEIGVSEICRKYISPQTARKLNAQKSQKKKTNIEVSNFSKHVDTEQFKYEIGKIEKGSLISIHSKRHGTSFRCSYIKTIRSPKNFFQCLLKKVGLFKGEKYEYLVGSRNVILYSDQYTDGFHGSEQFRFDVMDELKPYLTKDMIIYGEIVGYVNGSPIMGNHSIEKLKDKKMTKKYGKLITYTYGCKEHEFKFHIYRISISNDDIQIDFSDKQCRRWCKDRGFDYARSVCEPFIYDGNAEALRELVERLTERPECLCEDYTDSRHISEGVVLRVENERLIPAFQKQKSLPFKICESTYKTENVDMEDVS